MLDQSHRGSSPTARFHILRIMAALILFGAAGLHAQEKTTLTIDDALRIAFERSPDLQLSANDTALSVAAIEQQRASQLPNLSLSISPSERIGRGFEQTTGSIGTQATTGLGIGVSSSMTLFNGFATRNAIAEAEQNLLSSRGTLERTRQTLVFNVVTQFLQTVLDSALIGIAQDNLRAEQDVLERVTAFTKAGKKAVSDLYGEQATVASAELRVIQTQHDYELSRARLVNTLQLDPLVGYSFVAPAADTTAPANANLDFAALLAGIMASRPDIAAQQARVAAAAEAIKVARAGYYPSVSVSGNVGTSYSSQNANDPFGAQLFSNNPNASVGLSIGIPIFDRKVTQINEERAIIQRDNELLRLRTLQQQISLDLRGAYLDYLTATKQIDVTNRQFTSAAEALKAEQERYRVGVSTLVELSQARAKFLSAETDRTQAVYTLLLKGRAIEYYRGTIAQPGR
ncbi:MAG: TolC family protein [Candidatus Kapaibacterium sp.]